MEAWLVGFQREAKTLSGSFEFFFFKSLYFLVS